MINNRRDHWSPFAVCAGLDPKIANDVFFNPRPGRPSKNEPWSKYCSNCPVTKQCFEWAMVHNVDGIWGNTTKSQRDHPFLADYRKNLKEQAKEEGWLEKYPNFHGLLLQVLEEVEVEFLFEFEEPPDTFEDFDMLGEE